MIIDPDILDSLLERLYAADSAECQQILEELQATNPEHAAAARRLLLAADSNLVQPGGALSIGVLQGVDGFSGTGEEASHPDQVGPWRIVRELGRGGMGVVYLAERAEDDFEQQVALKLLPAGPQSDHLLARFEQERRILASLDHPGIARLIDGGVSDGAPWFAMEYVEGSAVDDYCDRHRLTVDERLDLFIEVAEAVQAAHRSLVVHRDLKPGNILITEEGPDDSGRVKLLDFGIAKSLEGEAAGEVTQTLQRVLTPEYTSPEQIRGQPITTASDVYQLGLLLHELLTGRRAHQLTETTPQGIERAVCEEPPTRPSVAAVRPPEASSEGGDAEALAAARSTTPRRLQRRLAGDLDNIVLTALRKEPERRYSSSEQMADDVRRHLEALPVRARPDTVGYRTSRFVRRHAVGFAAGVAMLLLVAALVTVYTIRLQRERDRARAEAAKAEQVAEFLGSVFRLSDPRASGGEDISVRQALDQGAERIRTDLAGQPEVQGELMDVLGRTYMELGDFDRAEELLTRALDLRRRHLGIHPDVAETLRHVGLLWHQQGQYERVEEPYLKAVAILEQTEGPEALELGAVLNNLGNLYKRTGEYDKGVAAFERALAIRESHLGPDAVDVGKVVNNLGALLYTMGEDRRALSLYERALTIYERQLGPDHPFVAGTLGNISIVRQRLGDHEELEPILQRMLAIQRKAYGPVHAKVGTALNSVGGFYAVIGRSAQAQEAFRQAADVYRQALGPDHAYVAYPLFNLGDLHLSEGRPAQAVAYLREATEIRETALGSEHPLLAGCLEGLGQAQAQLGQLATAESNLRRALGIRRRPESLGDDLLASSLVHLARFLVSQQRCDEALPALQEAGEILEAQEDTDPDAVAEIKDLSTMCTSQAASAQ